MPGQDQPPWEPVFPLAPLTSELPPWALSDVEAPESETVPGPWAPPPVAAPWAQPPTEAQAYASAQGWTDNVIAQVELVAQQLGVPFKSLILVWNFESDLSPAANNAGVALGLNQIQPGNLEAVRFFGSPDAYINLSISQQLPYIRRYYQLDPANEAAFLWYAGLSDELATKAVYLANAGFNKAWQAGNPDYAVYEPNTAHYEGNPALVSKGQITTQSMYDAAERKFNRSPLAQAVVTRYQELFESPLYTFGVQGEVGPGGSTAAGTFGPDGYVSTPLSAPASQVPQEYGATNQRTSGDLFGGTLPPGGLPFPGDNSPDDAAAPAEDAGAAWLGTIGPTDGLSPQATAIDVTGPQSAPVGQSAGSLDTVLLDTIVSILSASNPDASTQGSPTTDVPSGTPAGAANSYSVPNVSSGTGVVTQTGPYNPPMVSLSSSEGYVYPPSGPLPADVSNALDGDATPPATGAGPTNGTSTPASTGAGGPSGGFWDSLYDVLNRRA